MTVEPMAIFRLTTYPTSVILADVAKLVEAVPTVDRVRIIPELPEVLDALRTWCDATGNVILREDECHVLTVRDYIADYEVDLRGCLPIIPSSRTC